MRPAVMMRRKKTRLISAFSSNISLTGNFEHDTEGQAGTVKPYADYRSICWTSSTG